MSSLPPEPIAHHLGSPERKRAYNQRLFTVVAPRYDLVTRALSGGRDAVWKRRLVDAVADRRPALCVDLACGTGDIARLLRKRFPSSRIIGLDLTPRMLELARRRSEGQRIEFRQGDMGRTGLPTASAELVTGGYALRNAPCLDQALAEVHRLLRPGGAAAFLDFSRPSAPAAQHAESLLLRCWGGWWGWLLHRDPAVYGYIADSLERFPDRAAWPGLAARHGLTLIHRRRFLGGITELMVLEKPASSG